MTENDKAGSYLNYENAEQLGKHIYIDKIDKDSFNIEGVDKNGLFWRELKKDGISIGYLNVKKSKISFYNRILKTISRKKR